MTEPADTGEFAERPRHIPARGWLTIGKRVWAEMGADHLSLIAAGVAFYGLLALFPAITALMAVAGLLFEADDVISRIETISAIVPEAAAEIIIGQATAVTGSEEGGLGLAALVGFTLAIWSASKGVGSLMEGINVAYDEEETRGFVALTVTRLGLTLFLVVGMIAGLSATIILPSLLQLLTLGPTTEVLIGLVRWAVLLLMTALGLSILYRFAPSRPAAKWRWLSPGALLATVLWVVASAGFAVYVQNFGSYQETFGALAGAIILLMWLWISALLVLLGAELNAETEAQTRVDTTVGQPMPMGARGAVKADTLAS
ncbi:YihY/virulence factor BrkB family protein [Oceanicola sp. 502str15]|uniref:YihY/virulence factor BrkB family protein n=1 Tax=Oceanicola sp. 502str15 TaxID=2696061 RepID=UPI0020949993|nr:YihY/virulence factor BrkB family protein [Oceanicola sp. 502str15]MCO6383353.1 YihY family inner membrane protein [Oceanicola sp. 502str15]